MRIAIIATGSRGDVQPYIALGKGLQSAGHEIRLLTHQNFEALARAQGLEPWILRGDVQQVAQSEAMQACLESGNFLGIMAQMAKEAEQAAVQLAEEALEVCRGMDLLLGGMGGLYTGLALCEKLDLPFLQAYLLPFTPTRQFPTLLADGLPFRLPPGFNRLSHHLTRQVFWQGFRRADRRSRRQVLGLPPAPFLGPYRSPHLRGMPVLYGFSPAVIRPPADWGDDTHVTGYWSLEPEDGWEPDPGLGSFLEAGPPPVYIGFGSMGNRDPRATAELVLKALEMAGQRAVLSSGWGGLEAGALPDTVFPVGSVPHHWLFPRMAAVVHHGGAGTTAAGLQAGVPSIVVPFFGDQPFWGRRVRDLGVGPEPIPRRALRAEPLVQAIGEAVSDPQMRQRAAELGAQIRAEDGIGRAAAVLERLAAG